MLFRRSFRGITALLLLISALYTGLWNLSQTSINSIWIGENFEYLDLKNDSIIAEFSNSTGIYFSKSKEKELILVEKYFSNGNVIPQTRNIEFKIKKLTEKNLCLVPMNRQASELINEKDKINFTKKEYFYDSDLLFEKLCFSMSAGFQKMKIEIDSSGVIYYHADADSTKITGDFTGQLTKEEKNLLIRILRTSDINHFPEEIINKSDSQQYEFHFFYSHKEKNIQCSHIKYFHRPVLDFILQISQNKSLIHSTLHNFNCFDNL